MKIKSLKTRLLEVLSMSGIEYNPEKGFIDENGDEVFVEDFVGSNFIMEEASDFIKDILRQLDEFHENEMVINQKEKDLPLFINYLFRFDSSKKIMTARLNGSFFELE